MSFLDDLIRGIMGTPSGGDVATGFGILGFVFWVVVAIASVGAGLLIAKWAFSKYQYEGDMSIAPYRITWMGKYSSIEGNLSHNDSLDEEILEELEKRSDLTLVPAIIKQMRKEKKLHVYNFKITDEGEVVDDINKKMRIISPDDLTEPNFAWFDQKGKRSIGALIRGEKRRNVVFYHTTRMITIINEDGHEEIWIIASPVPMSEAKRYMGFKDKGIENFAHHMIEVTRIEGGKALAQIGSFAPTLAEAIQKFQYVRAERDNFALLYDETLQKLEDANMVLNKYKHMLSQKEYVGYGKVEDVKKSVMNFGWIVIGAVASFIMMKLMPEILPQLDLEVAQIAGMGIGLGIIGLAWKYHSDSQEENEQVIEE